MTRREALLFTIAFMLLVVFVLTHRPSVEQTVYVSHDHGPDYTVLTVKQDETDPAPISISGMELSMFCADPENAEAVLMVLRPKGVEDD